MTNMIINVRFMAGTSIEKAVEEAFKYAKKYNVLIEFKFNGVNMFITSYSNAKEEVEEYMERIKDE